VIVTFLVHLSLVTVFARDFFRGDPLFDPSLGWFLSVGWSGYAFHVCFLVSVVFIIMLLEKTLRASTGRQRWQIKFLALGIGALFAPRVYTESQILLFHGLSLDLEVTNAFALLVADLLILISMSRTHFLHVNIYLSQTILYHSFTLLIVGVYLLAVSVLAKAMVYVNGGSSLPLRAFFIFLALVGLTIALLSNRLRLKMKRLISRHFRRPQYDYRKVWMGFTERTASLVEGEALCNEVVKMISEMFDTLSVSLWLLDERRKGFRCGGSTVFSEHRARGLLGFRNGAADLLRLMRDQKNVVDIEAGEAEGVEALKGDHQGLLRQARIRYCVPLRAGGGLLGLITLDDRVRGEPFSFEELDMLRTIADQVAASLLNRRLSEQLQQAREMEAFQTIATLFVHDLKNVASKLSLLLQNLPAHFDNPEFREDALQSVSRCVKKINRLCSSLSLVRDQLEIRPVEADLNDVVKRTLADLEGIVDASIIEESHPTPTVSVDPEQIGKVLTNLVLNANKATGAGGKIRVTTGVQNGWLVLAVSDDGCGISREFRDQRLFRPFRSTERQGTGIGLFHSKMIVEAHKGEIEVESQEGKGSTFRVLLPLKGAKTEGLGHGWSKTAYHR
jgi:putative PEP-CTERM system histidine kinase